MSDLFEQAKQRGIERAEREMHAQRLDDEPDEEMADVVPIHRPQAVERPQDMNVTVALTREQRMRALARGMKGASDDLRRSILGEYAEEEA